MSKYHFSNLGLSGRIVLGERSAQWTCRYWWHGTYQREIPLDKLQPDYMRTIGPPDKLGTLTLVACFGVLVGLGLLSDRVPNLPNAVVAGVIGLTAITAAVLFAAYRNEEWIIFYGVDPGTYISYCRRGRDRATFEAFTNELQQAIRQAN